ncbi:MAG TPA: poly-beta-1,6-N-acetyl-D-glucosamine N-deacetylase PgaB [Alphaproteobacteria bacterium]|nr:poly-beta-1,6-N-acetyl-D-glucosamine N-deacetylase PgaB [Alphaproteobacteria bacterium]
MMRRLFFSLATAFLLFAKSASSMTAGDIQPMRVVQVDLDYVYDADPVQQQRNLDALVARIASMNVTTVFLQAFADPEGTELASQVYFKTSQLPMRADLFAQAVEALQKGAKVKVYGWLPVLAFDIKDEAQVLAWKSTTGRNDPDAKNYRRVSPFNLKARADVFAIYEDMARAAPIDGVLFHDDAMLSDFEDASPDALAFYAHAGLPTSIKDLRASPKAMQKWTDFKTAALTEFTLEIAQHVRAIRPSIQTARNLYASIMLNPQSEQWVGQNYEQILKSYDYAAVEAMPQMEGIAEDDAKDWLKSLVAAAAQKPNGLQRTVFELQAVDWRKSDERAIPSDMLADEVAVIAEQGAVNFGYYPDDFVTDTPKATIIHDAFSLQTTAAQR